MRIVTTRKFQIRDQVNTYLVVLPHEWEGNLQEKIGDKRNKAW